MGARTEPLARGLCKLSIWEARESWSGRLAKMGASSGQGQENGMGW